PDESSLPVGSERSSSPPSRSGRSPAQPRSGSTTSTAWRRIRGGKARRAPSGSRREFEELAQRLGSPDLSLASDSDARSRPEQPRAHCHVSGQVPSQEAVLVVPLRAGVELGKVLRLLDVVLGEARVEPARQLQHFAPLQRDQLLE